MRAIFWREFRELPGLVLALLAIPIAWFALGARNDGEDIAACMVVGGALLGLVQSVWDWFREDDAFSRHRPLSAARVEWARTLAGAAHVVLAVTALLGTLALVVRFTGGASAHAPTAAENALCFAFALATWACIRQGLGRDVTHAALFLACVPAALLMPIFLGESIRTAMSWAVAVLLVSVAGRFGRTSRAALCLLAACSVLIALGWARSGTTALLFETYPHVMMRPSGEVAYWQRFRRRSFLVDRCWRELVELKSLGSFVARAGVNARTGDTLPDKRVTAFQRIGGTGGMHGVLVDLARSLDRADGRRRGAWTVKAGRVVCLDTETGAEVAALATKFVEPELLFSAPVRNNPTTFWIVRQGDGRITFVSRRKQPPFTIEESSVRFDPPADFAGWSRGRVMLRSGDRLHMFDVLSGEVVREIAIEPGATSLRFGFHHADKPERWGWSSRMSAADPVRVVFRLRRWRADAAEDPLVREATLQPTGWLENTLAGLGGLVALARPPLLNGAAWASAEVESFSVLKDPWLDPWFRGRKRFGWLLGNIAVGLLCSWRARSQARLRLSHGGGVFVALAFLFGPLGLLWMRIWVPKLHVEEVGGKLRAVNLDEDWPEPRPDALAVVEKV